MSKSKIILIALAVLIGVPFLLSALGAFNSATTLPGRVTSETLKTNNVIANYNLFFQRKAQYDSRVAQIGQFNGEVAAATDSAEQSRLRMELAAQRQTCRETANGYNADAAKVNTAPFRGRDLPETLDATACESKAVTQ